MEMDPVPNLPIRNPYIAGNPVTGKDMFFGREDVFEIIQQTLIGEYRDNILVIYGQRRTGKTSLLSQLPDRLKPRYLCVFIDLHSLALENMGGFLWEMANWIILGLRKDYQIQLTPLKRSDFFEDPYYYFRNTFLENVLSSIEEKHLLLMFDEAIRLEEQVKAGKLDNQVFEYLRSLMQSYSRINYLFSLGSGIEELKTEYAFLFSVAVYLKISFLDQQSAYRLITIPPREMYTVQPEAVDRIQAITTGHPYFIQLICHSLFNFAQSNKISSITVDHINLVLNEVIERGMAVLRHVWDEASPIEKTVLAGMAAIAGENNRAVSIQNIRGEWRRYGADIPRGEMVKAAHNLVVRDVIAGEERFKFTVDLQRRFLQMNYPIELVWENTKDDLTHLPSEDEISSRFNATAQMVSVVNEENRFVVIIENLENDFEVFQLNFPENQENWIIQLSKAEVLVEARASAVLEGIARRNKQSRSGNDKPQALLIEVIPERGKPQKITLPLSRPESKKKKLIWGLFSVLLLSLIISYFAWVYPGLDRSKNSATITETAFHNQKVVNTVVPTELVQKIIATPNSVTGLSNVENATFQVLAEGTFVDPAIGSIDMVSGRGSGFLIDSTGLGVTNSHSVNGAGVIKVFLGINQKILKANVLAVSECDDLALIQVEGNGFPYLVMADNDPKVGQEIYSAGFPLGYQEYSLTKGIISRFSGDGSTRIASLRGLLFHTAVNNSGGSGGPLVDREGKVIGINMIGKPGSQEFYAAGVTQLNSIIQLLKLQKDHYSIGVNGQAVIDPVHGTSGIWISAIKSGSPADRAGLKPGDIITSLEGLVLATDGTMKDYCDILRSHKENDPMTISVIRYATGEILDGVLNGSPLIMKTKIITTSPTPEIMKISDDSKMFILRAPSSWQYDGKPFSGSFTIKGAPFAFTAQSLSVSPDIQTFTNGWSVKGLWLFMSNDFSKINDDKLLFDGMQSSFKDCSPDLGNITPYKDNQFKGWMRLYTHCGSNDFMAKLLVLRPQGNQNSLPFIVEIDYLNEADYQEMVGILATLSIVP